MQRTGKFLTVVLAMTVTASLFFLFRHLDATRRSPPLSAPDLRPISDRLAEREFKVRRVPTILSPDLVPDEPPTMVLQAGGDDSGRDWSREPRIPPEPLSAPPADQLDVPIRLLPMHQSLIPIPGPYENTDMR